MVKVGIVKQMKFLYIFCTRRKGLHQIFSRFPMLFKKLQGKGLRRKQTCAHCVSVSYCFDFALSFVIDNFNN